MRFRVGNAYLRESAKHCNFAGDDCWYVKTHPKIDSITAADGYITGGQEMSIKGWGLRGENGDVSKVDIEIDGIPCVVTETTMEEIKCITGAAPALSHDGVSQPGSPGFRQTIHNHANEDTNPHWNMFTDVDVPIDETKVLTAFENSFSNYTRAGTYTKGWFKAPETGNYKFYMSCDDACSLVMDSAAPFNKASPAEPTVVQIARRDYAAGGFRNYFMTPDPEGHQYQSEWISLTKGEFYKMEAKHL